MENLLLALALILALNLAFGLHIALSEVRSRWKFRREVGALESMWADDRSPIDHEPRRGRFVGRTTAAAAAALVLSGVAVASTGSTREAVISTVGGVVGAVDRFMEQPSVDAAGIDATIAPSAEEPAASASAGAQRDGATREPDGAGVEADTSSTASAAPSTIAAPTVDASPSPVAAESPVPPVFNASAEPLSETTIQVSWDPLPSATEYLVERSPDGVDAWGVVAQIPAGEFSTTADVPSGVSYFRVTATTDAGPVQATASASTEPASVPE
jgi:hypothetical protein